MICQKCGLSEATIHREKIVYRQKIEEHLCGICAGSDDSAARVPSVPAHSVLTTSEGLKTVHVPQDLYRPKELALPSKISLSLLAEHLRIKPFLAIAILMAFGVFGTLQTEIDYLVAARICEYCGVAAFPIDDKTA
jgi:hypothetical protein